MSPAVGKVELDRMTMLWKWWNASAGDALMPDEEVDQRMSGLGEGSRRVSAGSEGHGGRQGSLTLSEVHEGMFVDATFKVSGVRSLFPVVLMSLEIIHVIINTPPKPALELYISDGTVSPHSTRNYHNIDVSIPPSAVFPLAIKDLPPMSERQNFAVGNYMMIRNVRCKMYQGALELIWSELVTTEQYEKGWNRRRCQGIGKEDERAKLIES